MNKSPTLIHAEALIAHAVNVQRVYAPHLTGRNGERFNIFKLLGVGNFEVSTHSRMLRELLDPRGSHGQGPVFLERFISRLELPSFDCQTAKVDAEVGIGPVTETSGGRLDLVISDGTSKRVVIENKIFAAEQDNWTKRYVDHAPNAVLVYLTLDGREPTTFARDSRCVDNVVCVSYAVHITEWLKDCRKEAVAAPVVRESITQYLHLIQELTNQNPSKEMNEQLVRAVMNSSDSLSAYCVLREAEQSVYREVVQFIEGQLESVAKKMHLTFHGSPNQDYGVKGSGFEFRSEKMNNLKVRFEFDRSGYSQFAFGFVDDGQLLPAQRDRLRAKFTNAFGKPHSSDTWPAWVYWEQYQHWRNGDVLSKIRFGKFTLEVEEILKKLLELVEG